MPWPLALTDYDRCPPPWWPGLICELLLTEFLGRRWWWQPFAWWWLHSPAQRTLAVIALTVFGSCSAACRAGAGLANSGGALARRPDSDRLQRRCRRGDGSV